MKREVRIVVLQPIDIAVAFSAAYRRKRDGQWSPKIVRDDLNLPWSSLNLSLARLEGANVVRDGRVNRQALAAMLPALQYLVPAEPDRSRRVRGIATGVSAPMFERRILSREPLVWESENGDTEGVPIKPLHPRIPDAVIQDPERYSLLACLDAIRGGKAREFRIAGDKLRELAGLPPPMTR
ncbi:MAG: hypothetical protein JRI25_20670 [Deltaproteobacteria bacterium]|nr:hypothetical protein [Deltaproteobacteria bacterium]